MAINIVNIQNTANAKLAMAMIDEDGTVRSMKINKNWTDEEFRAAYQRLKDKEVMDEELTALAVKMKSALETVVAPKEV